MTLVLGLTALFASPGWAATAGTSYGPLFSFGSGDLRPDNPTIQGGIAVDPTTGNVLVSDPDDLTTRIYEPDPTGATLIGGIEAFSGTSALTQAGVSVDPGNGDVYIGDAFFGGIFKSDPDSSTPPNYTPDPSFNLDASHTAAVQPATAVDPITHDLLVADYAGGAIERFTPEGAFVSSFTGADTAAGAFSDPVSVAVGPTGDIYVTDDQQRRLERFNPSGRSLGALPIHGMPKDVTVDPVTGDVYVAEDFGLARRPFLESFTAAGEFQFRVRYPADVTGGASLGLAADGAGRIYSYVTTSAGPEVLVFAQGVQPGLDAPQVSPTATGAHLSAALNTGSATVTAHFEYCPLATDCEDYDFAEPGVPNDPWVATPDQTGLSGEAVNLQEDLAGLALNTAYRVRAYAETEQGVEAVSPESTFRTVLLPPAVQTHGASGITSTSATLNGTVNAEAGQTTYHYEYGTTTAYGSSEPAGNEAVGGAGTEDRSFPRLITGLQPGTTYHFRLVATNAAGTTLGADRTFTTEASAAPMRAYEQVTPTDKQQGAVTTTAGFYAAADGSAITYVMDAAPAIAASSVQQPRMMSRRGADGWLDWQPLDPPLGTQRGILGATTLAVSSDYNHALVATDRKLTPEGTEGAANLYVHDLATGGYTLVGTSTQPGALAEMISLIQNNTYLAGAPDFSWVVFEGRTPFLPGAAPHALYYWSAANGLSLASRMPGTDAPAAGNLRLVRITEGPRPLVSEDGSEMAFAMETGEVGVYRRAAGVTTALSVPRDGEPATPHAGIASAISRDGGSVVFTSDQLLAEAPAGGTFDIYLYEAATDALNYIGFGEVFAVSDDAHTIYYRCETGTCVWRNGGSQAVTGTFLGENAYASPNGRYLAWVDGAGDVQLYDADANRTVCASCLGDQPGGQAVLPEQFKNINNALPRVVLDDGTVFFSTLTRLVPADHNGASDVYEYRDGRQTLISSGAGDFPAKFADASSDGKDVFFTTAQGLVGQDNDDATDIYDARVGGGIPSQNPVVPPPCRRETCTESAASPPTLPTIGSVSFANGGKARHPVRASVGVAESKLIIGSAASLKVRVPGAGHISVAGPSIVRKSVSVSKVGSYSLEIALSSKGKESLKRKKTLKVRVRVSYRAKDGRSVSKTVAVTFKQPNAKPGKRKKGGR